MSNDSSQLEVVPAHGSTSDNDDSSRVVTYEDLVRNPELFWDTLRNFLESSGKSFEIPIVGGNSLDLHRLFNEVTSRGGLEKVIKDRKCTEVIDAFNFRTPITNAAFVLRKYYLKMLFELEHVYYFQAPLSSFLAKEKALKRILEKSANRDIVLRLLGPGVVVTGIIDGKVESGYFVTVTIGSEELIDGKFESGYFVTVTIGSEELKGVLYHIRESTPPETRQRRKKKSKSSQRDSQQPKSRRTGYNFFLSEQYARLKDEYAGQKGSILKEIGNMWSNLSESDRKVYQEKGLEDAKRYNMEMLQYNSPMGHVAETVDATDAAASTSASATKTSTEASQ